MKTSIRILLAVDALINLILGILLLFLPAGLLTVLGLPATSNYFYTSILGGVIFGIGVALSIEYFQKPIGARGLGLAGAIAINLCGGGVLLFWLLFGNLGLNLIGQVTLWIVAFVVIGIGLIEILVKPYQKS